MKFTYICTKLYKIMTKERPLILVTNDDGITAPGITFFN